MSVITKTVPIVDGVRASVATGGLISRRSRQFGLRGELLRTIPFSIVLLIVMIGPQLVPRNPTKVVGPNSAPPNAQFWFGTDTNGLDVFSRTIAATRLDVEIAVGVTAIATVVAIALGLGIGLLESRRSIPGLLARLLGRLLDLVQSIPVMVAGLVLVSFFGRNALVITLALGIVLIPFQTRLVRTEVLKVRGAGYVEAARMSGETELRLALRHVLPNGCRPAIENTSAIFAMAIIYSAALGFLGVGIPLPTPEWGSMLALGASDAAVGRWWGFLFPAIALAFAVWSASVLVSTVVNRIDRR